MFGVVKHFSVKMFLAKFETMLNDKRPVQAEDEGEGGRLLTVKRSVKYFICISGLNVPVSGSWQGKRRLDTLSKNKMK